MVSYGPLHCSAGGAQPSSAVNSRNTKASEVGIGDGRGTVLFGNPTRVLILSDPSDMSTEAIL